MKETELTPIEDELKERAKQYLCRIVIETNRFQTFGTRHRPTVIMSKDVFDVLQTVSVSCRYIDYEDQTVCGCEVDFVSGTNKLYVGLNLLEQENKQ